MIIYSVHIQLEPHIEQDWLAWMQTVHIPEVIQHKGFIKYQIIKIENPELCQYRIDYHIENMELYNEYQQKYAPELQKKHTERYQGKFTAHRTVGSVI
jgi:hypothetical protein